MDIIKSYEATKMTNHPGYVGLQSTPISWSAMNIVRWDVMVYTMTNAINMTLKMILIIDAMINIVGEYLNADEPYTECNRHKNKMYMEDFEMV